MEEQTTPNDMVFFLAGIIAIGLLLTDLLG